MASVQFEVEPAAAAAYEQQFHRNDIPAGKTKLQWMVFKINIEKARWDLVGSGEKKSGWFASITKLCPKDDARIICFRSEDQTSDISIKYIPEISPVKIRTCYSCNDIFKKLSRCKNHFDMRDQSELVASNPKIANYLK